MVNYFTHIVAQQRLLEMPPFKLMLDYKNLTKYPTLLSFGMKCEGKGVIQTWVCGHLFLLYFSTGRTVPRNSGHCQGTW